MPNLHSVPNFIFKLTVYMNNTQFSYIINIQGNMSFYYILSSPLNSYAPLQPIYYVPSQYQQTATNLILINPTNPSQVEQKQNFILQSNVSTRESLQQESDQRPKDLKKKRIPKKEKDESFGWRNQNKDRNILSNILKAFNNYLLEHEGMRNYLEQLTKKLSLQSGVSDFHQHLQLNFPITKSYISPKQLKNVLKDPAQPKDFVATLKFALLKFLRDDYVLILLKSTKIKRRSKLEQMKKCRQLIEILFNQ